MAAISASIFGSFWVALGLLILLTDARAFRRAGPLRRRRTRIADLEDGRSAKLVGVIRLHEGDALEAPISGRACAGWVVATARRRWFRWRRLGTQNRTRGFYLDDGTGEVFVPLDRCSHLDLRLAARAHKLRRQRTPRRLRALLEPHVEADEGGTFRCDERALFDGMRVAVYAVFRSQPDRRAETARTYRGRTYCFVAEPAPEDGVHISDDRATLG